MKTLTLIRHARAALESPSNTDFDRPLNYRGHKDAPRMGHYLKSHLEWQPDGIISSPALRALTTAQFMAVEIGHEASSVLADPTIYEAEPSNLLASIRRMPDAWSHGCLVGHNPGLERLAMALVGPEFVNGFVTCGVAILELKVDRWQQTDAFRARLIHFLYPEALWGEEHR